MSTPALAPSSPNMAETQSPTNTIMAETNSESVSESGSGSESESESKSKCESVHVDYKALDHIKKLYRDRGQEMPELVVDSMGYFYPKDAVLSDQEYYSN